MGGNDGDIWHSRNENDRQLQLGPLQLQVSASAFLGLDQQVTSKGCFPKAFRWHLVAESVKVHYVYGHLTQLDAGRRDQRASDSTNSLVQKFGMSVTCATRGEQAQPLGTINPSFAVVNVAWALMTTPASYISSATVQ